MKINFFLITLIFFCSCIGFGQEVTREAVSLTEEQQRVQKVRAEIDKQNAEIVKAFKTFEDAVKKYRPYDVVLQPTREKLEKKLQDIEQVQYALQSSGLIKKSELLTSLYKSIGIDDRRNNYEGMAKGLEERHKKIRDQLADLEKKQGEEATNKKVHESNIARLDNEIAALDAQLLKSKAPSTKKSKSIDDFLTDKGITKTSNTKKKTGNSLDKVLTSSGSSKTTKSNNLDEMLESSSSKSKNNSLDNAVSVSSANTDYKIDHKEGRSGVITSSGKILIPYKNWEIVEYKMGIAKVRETVEYKTLNSCSSEFKAFKEGFVDKSGDFIDGFEIDFAVQEYYKYSKLVLISTPIGRTPAQREADERAEKRRKELKRKEEEIKQKKCEVELDRWKKSIITKYK